MRKLALLFGMMILLSSFALAESTQNNFTLSETAAWVAGSSGMLFTPNVQMTLINVTRGSSTTHFNISILDVDNVTLTQGNFTSGDVAVLNPSLALDVGSVYQVVVTGNGTMNLVSSGASYPAINVDLNWTNAKDTNGQLAPTTAFVVDAVGYSLNVSDITVSLVNPINGTSFATVNNTFSALIETDEKNISNATLQIWHVNGTIFNESLVNVSGKSNTSTFTQSITEAGTYSWNVFACAIDGSTSNCTTATDNRSFDFGISYDSSSFSNFSNEGNLETFILNITFAPGSQISIAELIYNGTKDTSAVVNLGNDQYQLTNDINVPSITGTTDFGFFWNITTDTGVEFNSANETQTVVGLDLDACSVNTIVLMNLSYLDEETQVNITGDQNTTIEVDIDLFPIGSSTPVFHFNRSYADINPAQICISAINDSTYRLDATIRYDSDDHVSEFYNIQNFTIQNATIPQNINLLGLATADSQEFLITFKDESFLPVEGALVDITRFYISEGVFKTVEIPKTDSSGQTLGHFVLSDVIYTLNVKKDGKLLATFDNVFAKCNNQATGDCTINLDAFSTGTPPEDFFTLFNTQYSMTFDEENRRITVTFISLDSSVGTYQLNGTLFDNYANTSICSPLLTSSSGTLTCDIPESFGNVSIVSAFYKNGEQITQAIYTIQQDAIDVFGGTRAIILMIMLMIIPLMMVTNAAGVVIGGIIGLILAVLLNIIDTPNLIGFGSTIIWLIVAGGILIWKINQQR